MVVLAKILRLAKFRHLWRLLASSVLLYLWKRGFPTEFTALCALD